ncbi:MAG: smalltalk protein [Paludibacteraceae bacterium]|nr:smalltalk protein [Paludibacteraceae bacterium]
MKAEKWIRVAIAVLSAILGALGGSAM